MTDRQRKRDRRTEIQTGRLQAGRCADPEFIARGGGVQARLPEYSSDAFFIPQLILQFYSELSMVYFKENYNFPRVQRGPTFSRWVPTFSRGGGVQHFLGGPTFSR